VNMPKPSAGHSLLGRLAGTWKGRETMHPSQWDPEGGVASGHNENVLALGGFALISDYHQERNGAVTFSGHGVYTYSPDDDRYRLHWFDSMGSPPEVFEGVLERDVLELAHGGPGMHARLTYRLAKPDRMDVEMEMSPDGIGWSVLFEATYERV